MVEKIRNKMKESKGFTLVELIVVLVILAILAAMLVPALTGYIDKANKEKVTAECRQVVMAAQTEASSLYGKANGGAITLTDTEKAQLAADIAKLSETKGKFIATITTGGTVSSVIYQNAGWQVTYTAANTNPYDDPVQVTGSVSALAGNTVALS